MRAQLEDLRDALVADPATTRDFYKGLLGAEGLTFETDKSCHRARFIVRGAVDLSKQGVTPPGIEPGIAA